MQGKKYDDGKAPMGLLPRVALLDTAKVLAFGAAKYGRDNWKQGLKWTRLSDAALRHLYAFIDGEDDDEESGLPHLAHCMCCLMFLSWHTRHRKNLDDRYKEESKDADSRNNTSHVTIHDVEVVYTDGGNLQRGERLEKHNKVRRDNA